MNLRDELEARPAPGNQCLMCVFLQGKTPEEQAQWHDLLTDPDPALTIVKLFVLARKKGFGGQITSFRNHRIGHEVPQ